MGSAASRASQEDHHSLVHVPSSHRFTLSSHLFAGRASHSGGGTAAEAAHEGATAGADLETSEGKIMKIAGGGNKRTVVQLDLPETAPDYRQVGQVKHWWPILRDQQAQDRMIEVRITISLVHDMHSNSCAAHWPRCMYFDAELSGARLAPDADSYQHDLVQTIRFEKELVGLHRGAQATLVIKPELVSFFLHPSFRIAFRGSSLGGDAYIRVRASPWERMTLPAGFDPRADPGHQCMMNGERLCQPVNQLSELGIGGRHFEYQPIDVDDTRALSLAARWHQVLESARHAPAASRLSSPTGDVTTLQTPSVRGSAPGPAPSPYHTPHLYERRWAAETLDQPEPAFVAPNSAAAAATAQTPSRARGDVALHVAATAARKPHAEEKETDDADQDPFAFHAAVASPQQQQQADNLNLLRTPQSARHRTLSSGRSPGARGARLPPLSSKAVRGERIVDSSLTLNEGDRGPRRSPMRATPGSGPRIVDSSLMLEEDDREPRRSPTNATPSSGPADLHITVASTPMASATHSAASAAKRQRAVGEYHSAAGAGASPHPPAPYDAPIYPSTYASSVRPLASPLRLVPPSEELPFDLTLATATAPASSRVYDPFSAQYASPESTRHTQKQQQQQQQQQQSVYGRPYAQQQYREDITTYPLASPYASPPQLVSPYPPLPQPAYTAAGRLQHSGFFSDGFDAPPPMTTTLMESDAYEYQHPSYAHHPPHSAMAAYAHPQMGRGDRNYPSLPSVNGFLRDSAAAAAAPKSPGAAPPPPMTTRYD